MTYSSRIDELIAGDRPMPLGPGSPNASARPGLEQLTVATAFAPHPVSDETAARCCIAALWLLHDFLDESHTLSQDIGTVEGSYWHGIMHRREPDDDNAKYWFRRVGRHPVFETLLAEAAAIDGAPALLTQQTTWDPFAFVDLCARARRGDDELERVCRAIQQAEWRLLFDFCYRRAAGVS